jgi:hypothetical protein
MKAIIARSADEDGWKAVTVDQVVVGHVQKVGDSWRARITNPRNGRHTEHLGFKTSKSAAFYLENEAS